MGKMRRPRVLWVQNVSVEELLRDKWGASLIFQKWYSIFVVVDVLAVVGAGK